jgi:predicted metal-dependent phosphoesterase TrpH
LSAKLESFDLHIHSTFSDGTKTPFELIDMTKAVGLKGLSITDHDTVSAYSDEVFAYAKQVGVELISGVEFSTEYQKRDGFESIHILGYNINTHHPKIQEFCLLHKERRSLRVKEMVKKLQSGGFDISEERVLSLGKESVGRPHIALSLIEKGYVVDMKEAFKKLLGEKAPYFVKSVMPTIEETIAVIKISGGKAVLAHPILIKNQKTLKKLLQLYNFNGMECYYGNFQLSDVSYLLKIAEERNLIKTGGSDYHGEHRNFVSIGSSFTTKDSVRALSSTL